ncbi:MAG: hypothetical protein IKT25_00525, partial [Firmicutes bacterium]|nr:hypothetical protein [Bacillota bacterium]
SCPYTVLAQNGGKVSGHRRTVRGEVVQRKEYGEEVTVLVLRVGRGLAQKASLPGSFVFLRRVYEEERNHSATETGDFVYFDTPISVMRADEAAGTIHLAIRREGPKSKLLLDCVLSIDDGYEDSYWIRGPYYSGLLGREHLRPAQIKGKRILFLTKGIGAAPALLTMDRLMTMDGAVAAASKIRWLADDRKIDRALIEDYARMIHGTIQPEYMALTDSSGRVQRELWDALEDSEYDVAVICGSPYFVEHMRCQVRNRFPEVQLVVSNNAPMCCGEGICGACTEVTEDGRVIRRCKCGK